MDCLLAELVNISNPKCKILGNTERLVLQRASEFTAFVESGQQLEYYWFHDLLYSVTDYS